MQNNKKKRRKQIQKSSRQEEASEKNGAQKSCPIKPLRKPAPKKAPAKVAPMPAAPHAASTLRWARLSVVSLAARRRRSGFGLSSSFGGGLCWHDSLKSNLLRTSGASWKFSDVIHGSIAVEPSELAIIDSRYFSGFDRSSNWGLPSTRFRARRITGTFIALEPWRRPPRQWIYSSKGRSESICSLSRSRRARRASS